MNKEKLDADFEEMIFGLLVAVFMIGAIGCGKEGPAEKAGKKSTRLPIAPKRKSKNRWTDLVKRFPSVVERRFVLPT